jgi:dihydroorotate dehydrogenase electron transfer subunit
MSEHQENSIVRAVEPLTDSFHRLTLHAPLRVVGRGTKLLSELRPGQALSLIGPLGRGFGPMPAGSVCLVGGGIGIAPLLFLADRWRSSDQACTVLLGSRTGDELRQLAAEFEALGCRVETATDDGSLGHHPKSICVWSACDDGHGGRVM